MNTLQKNPKNCVYVYACVQKMEGSMNPGSVILEQLGKSQILVALRTSGPTDKFLL